MLRLTGVGVQPEAPGAVAGRDPVGHPSVLSFVSISSHHVENHKPEHTDRSRVQHTPAELATNQEAVAHSPDRLVLHHADGRRRAEDGGVVVFIRDEEPRGDRPPAPLRGVRGLVCGAHHQEEGRRGLPVQLLSQAQNAAEGIQRQEVVPLRPAVLDGVHQLAVWPTAVLQIYLSLMKAEYLIHGLIDIGLTLPYLRPGRRRRKLQAPCSLGPQR